MNILVLTGIDLETKTIAPQPGITVLQGNSGRAQLLDSKIDPEPIDRVLSWGTCGAIKPGVLVGTVCVSTLVFDHSLPWKPCYTVSDWRSRIARLLSQSLTVTGGAVYSGSDEQTDTAAAKATVFKETGCVSADEGSYAVAQWAIKNKKPWAVIGGVSDSADQTVVWPPGSTNEDGTLNAQATLQWLAKQPPQVFEELLREGWTTAYSLRALRVAASTLAANNWGL